MNRNKANKEKEARWLWTPEEVRVIEKANQMAVEGGHTLDEIISFLREGLKGKGILDFIPEEVKNNDANKNI